MNFFALKFGLSTGSNQSEIMQLLKSNGAEVIQTSDGLCVKAEQSLEQLKELVVKPEMSGVTWEQLDKDKTLFDEDTATDVKAFMKS